MAFTYTGPASSDRDHLRFVVGDTQALRHLLEDAEVDHLLATFGGVRPAVVPAVDRMIAVASQEVDYDSGDEGERASQRAAALRQLRADLVGQGYPDPATDAIPAGVSRVRRFERPSGAA